MEGYSNFIGTRGKVFIFRNHGDLKKKDVCRILSISSEDLVPGDVILFDDHIKIPCDCVLISG